MSRKPIDPELRTKALAAVAESMKQTGKPDIDKNAEAVGVKPATLRAWWNAQNPGAKKKARKAAVKEAAKQATAKAKPRPRRGRPSKTAGLKTLEASIARIEAELTTIKDLFARYRDELIEKIRQA